MENWPTKEKDLAEAVSIIQYYQELNDNEPLELFDASAHQDGSLVVENPEWVIAIADRFDELYGFEQGAIITEWVMTQVLLRDETIH